MAAELARLAQRVEASRMRLTAVAMLKSLGVPARDAQIILGHANIAVTLGVHSEVFDTEIATALGRINDAPGADPQRARRRRASRRSLKTPSPQRLVSRRKLTVGAARPR